MSTNAVSRFRAYMMSLVLLDYHPPAGTASDLSELEARLIITRGRCSV